LKKIQDKKRVVKSLDLKSKKTLLVFLPSLTALLWIACQSGSIVGDVLIDAGDALSDSNASAQEPGTLQRNCDIEREWTVTYESGQKSTYTSWFAEVALAAEEEDSIYNVDVVLCDYTDYGEPFVCPNGVTCEGTLTPYGKQKCVSSVSASFKEGTLWVSCGSRSRQWNPAGQLTGDSGSKAAVAKITIWK
jgi:hypothetical protein